MIEEQNWLTRNRHLWEKRKKNVLIFAEAYAMCIERNVRNNHDVDIRSSPMTSMERKNFDVVRWLFLMVKFFCANKIVSIAYSSALFLFCFLPIKETSLFNNQIFLPPYCSILFILLPFQTTRLISLNDINSLWHEEFQYNQSYFDNDLYSYINRISTIYIRWHFPH